MEGPPREVPEALRKPAPARKDPHKPEGNPQNQGEDSGGTSDRGYLGRTKWRVRLSAGTERGSLHVFLPQSRKTRPTR